MANKRVEQQERRSKARSWATEEPEKRAYEPTAVKLPEGVEWIKFEAKTQTVTWDFMPYRCGRHNKRADEGELHYVVEFEQHRVPGADGRENRYVCGKFFDKPCAVCKYLNSKRPDKDTYNALKGKTRLLWVINDKPGDKKNPLKVLETAMYNRGMGFGEQVRDLVTSIEEEEFVEDCFPFSLKGGRSVQMKIKEEEYNGNPYGNPTRLDLIPRKYDYPESVLDAAPCLDECLIEPDYDLIWALLNGEEVAEKPAKAIPKAPEPPKGRAPTPADDEDDDLDDDLDDEEDEQPVRRSRR